MFEGLDKLIIIGALSLGGFVGVLTGIFVHFANLSKRENLAAAVASVGASGVLALLAFLVRDGGVTREVWLYPPGLLIGFFLGVLIAHLPSWRD